MPVQQTLFALQILSHNTSSWIPDPGLHTPVVNSDPNYWFRVKKGSPLTNDEYGVHMDSGIWRSLHFLSMSQKFKKIPVPVYLFVSKHTALLMSY
jgi:hypothetical protein